MLILLVTLSNADQTAIVNRLEGTSGMDDGYICDEYDIDIEELEEIMLAHNYERCSDCGWWCESGDLVDEEGEPCSCSSCR